MFDIFKFEEDPRVKQARKRQTAIARAPADVSDTAQEISGYLFPFCVYRILTGA